jgi:hypothetical protein
MADSTFTFRVDEEPKQRFAQAAGAQERTSAQLLRVLMRDAVHPEPCAPLERIATPSAARAGGSIPAAAYLTPSASRMW